MESAIDLALRCPRTQARRLEDDYTPSYPAWTARAQQNVRQVFMAYLGVQWRGDAHEREAFSAFQIIISSLDRDGGCRHYDLTRYVDAQGYENLIAIAYWTDVMAFETWKAGVDVEGWWSSAERLAGPVGVFREILSPSMEAFETLFSASDRMEAVGVALGERSKDIIQEHGYWGSMRDRLASSQTEPLLASGKIRILSGCKDLGHRVIMKGNQNLAVIRSGQDWTDTTDHERQLYLKEMEPVLQAGMDYLRDHGLKIGCYCNRYMRRLDSHLQPIDKSLGYSLWRSLSEMEEWAESHPTHVAIFGKFMQIVQELNFQIQLRLYHEVSVLDLDQQHFEYVNCHPASGLMNGVAD